MRYNKKGLSTVVTTLIIILLVLVSIGIIWVVVRNVIETGTGEFDAATRCLKIDIRATSVDCGGSVNSCNVTVERKAGGAEIGGIKIVFKNTSIPSSGGVLDQPGDIAVLTSETFSGLPTGYSNLSNRVEITAYVKDDTGTEFVCGTTSKFSF